MAVYYPSGCDENIPSHDCNVCNVELGRVRSVAFINKQYYPTLIADPEDASLWAAGFASGDIFIYPETQGEFDGGTPNVGQGYGDTEETLNSYTFNLMAKDPNYVGNRNHWNGIKGSRNFHVAFRSETVLRISDVPVGVIPTNPISNDLKSEVVWDFACKWTSANFPTEYTTPDGVFQCVASN